MKIENYIVEKNYNDQKYYIKFKRMIFGFIPMWFYLKKVHFNKEYKHLRLSVYVISFLLSFILFNIFIDYHRDLLIAEIFTIVATMMYFSLHMYFDREKIYRNVSEDANYSGAKEFGEKNIAKFNRFFEKIKKEKETVFSSNK